MAKKSFRYLLLAAIVIIVIISGCKKQDIGPGSNATSAYLSFKINNGSKKNFSNDVATKWFDVALDLIKTKSFSPPVASRALGYTGVTLYESMVESMPQYATLKSVLGYAYTLPNTKPGVKYYWPAVANAAMHTIINNLFIITGNSNSSIEDVYNGFHQQYTAVVGSDDLINSEAYGAAVANIIFEWSKTDGIASSYTDYYPGQYTLPVFDGAWIPTAPGFQPPLLPFWGNNRPFLMKDIDDACVPPALPYNYSINPTSDFYKQANEVYQTVNNLTPAQKNIALYWNDGGGSVTPPGHNLNIATQMIRNNNLNLNEAAIVYAKVGMAAADAFIACWKGKYKYNVMRPITYIQRNIDATWSSLITTPPFPTYCSGHATVSGATSAVLTEIFGDNIKFTDHTYDNTYGPKQFNSFYDAAAEAALSRLYGGIHFRIDNEVGLQKGKAIGMNIAGLQLKK